MLFEQARCFDRTLVASVDEKNAGTLDLHERNIGHGLGGGSGKRRYLRTGLRGVGGPAAAFPQIDEPEIGTAILGHFAEKRLLLRTADSERRARARERANPVELRPAELAAGNDIAVAAAACQRVGIERHRV